MSAVAGIYNFTGETMSMESSSSMMKELQRFPADHTQVWRKRNLFLGCHAQWITPESVGEQNPFYDSDRQLVITADAILDNRDELFRQLEVDRGQQGTMPDVQLILLAYLRWGEDVPKHLVGDFAFMIWDEKNRKLFGARDFSGSRTLYYYRDEHRFAFCSTIMPLLSLPYIDIRLNEEWLAEYLAISGLIDAANPILTPYQHVEQIPPSHSIVITENKITFSKYCTIVPEERLKLRTNEEYVEAFQEVFQQAVQSRLRTHRGIGAQLSGGLDSGSVVSFAARALKSQNKQLHTFSYVPPKDFENYLPRSVLPDERPFIQETVKFVGGLSDHYLDFAEKDSYSEIDPLLNILEMPYKYFENSFWMKGMYEKARDQNLGVLLNGARGNLTISWGPAFDYYALLMKRMKWIRLFFELDQYSKRVGGARFRLLPEISKLAFPLLAKLFTSDEDYEFPILINQAFAERTNIFKKLKFYGLNKSGWFATTNVYRQRYSHFKDSCHWNTSNVMTSKLSLQYSVWERDPTNDIRVLRFCLSIPENQYVQNGFDRALIRRSTKHYLPDKVRLNQRIRGVQGADWLHRVIPFWKSMIEELNQICTEGAFLSDFIEMDLVKSSLLRVLKKGVRPEYALEKDYRLLMRTIILHRFLKRFS